MTIFTLLVALMASFLNPMEAQNAKIYPKTAVVIEVNYNADYVTVADKMGREWGFTGVEDWVEGDIASLLMSDNATEDNCFDDIILQARYDGWIDNYENWFYKN